MKRATLALLALLVTLAPAQAAPITGQYVEARTCDVWTGPCFANADFNLGGKHAVLAWKIDKGTVDGVNLDGLSVVAVVSAQNTLGLEQSSPAKSVLIIDGRANSVQKEALVQFAKQLLKLSIVILICWFGIKDNLTTLYALAHASPHDIIITIEGIVFWIGLRVGLLLLVLGIADYVWERRRLENSLKMTKTEVRDEHRQSEGNPEAKSALRQRQRAAARKRMMAAVPKATVVVTNPTHFAVALLWDELKMDAPVLVAKGADLIAKTIREIAEEHNVPILENPPLARTLYAKVELDSPVPPDLYAAVAQVIAFVYKLKNRTIA